MEYWLNKLTCVLLGHNNKTIDVVDSTCIMHKAYVCNRCKLIKHVWTNKEHRDFKGEL
jgi:hypothetical protein